MFTGKTKRKNDAPHSRRRLLLIASLLSLLLVGLGVAAAQQFQPVTSTPISAGYLNYVYSIDPTTEAFVEYNFQTGQSSYSIWPQPTIRDDRSHDGQWEVAWEEVSGAYAHILLLRKTGTTQVVRELGLFFRVIGSLPRWSYDDQWVVFSAYENIDGQESAKQSDIDLWMVNVETGQARRLTNNDSYDGEPIFSPDGRSIAYISMVRDLPRLTVLTLETGQSRVVTMEHVAYRAAWSPDSTWLVFTTNRSANPTYNRETMSGAVNAMWLIRADGTDAQLFTEDLGSHLWALHWLENPNPTSTP